MRLAILLAASALLATPAFAETVKCADAKGEVAVEYDIGTPDEPNLITRVQMQIAGDFGISTDPSHEDYDGEDIAEQFVMHDLMSVTLRVQDRLPALQLKLAEASEGDFSIRAGVLAVAGGGVWAVVCEPGV